ncbi:mucoidy inhibitor MuiA family protein [Myxococcus sp. AM011]|uniref:mucoidy inhibitor MuiA family protein n=1 Tax=Myxococcus sp. AM011 TaxID=2745200 RepID=UPI001595A151|nr:mucoidy inhibitor MuiA family protein [Myxococcus sp. AM011]NVJ22503.1 mucoidy inhibitor MuiA family protein [Myxococcus sp. AM011]
MTLLPWAFLALASVSQVSSVVIYRDRAQVTRSTEVACQGATTVVFERAPGSASRESFRARATGATLEGLTAERRTLERELAPEREKWEARGIALGREQAVLDAAEAQARELSRLSQGYTDVAVARVTRELTGPRPDTSTWAAAFDAALAVRLRAVKEAGDLAERRRELEQRRAEVDVELARLREQGARDEHHVEVRLSCPQGKHTRVELTYLVGGVSWVPSYEARANEAEGLVELTSLATVRQWTGEGWTGAKLFLSTALPRQDATPPEVSPLLVHATKQPKERKVLVPREEQVRHVETAGETSTSESLSGLTVKSQGVSVQWEALEATRVPGDGSAVRVMLGRHSLPARFSWRTVPKLHPVVFRVARLSNTTNFPLLPGEVSLFRDTGYLGRQRVEGVAGGMPFDLTFGLAEGLRVKRTAMQEVGRAGLFGGKHRFRYAYRFLLSNLGTGTETVELSEHLPVSELEDVKVEVEPESSKDCAPADADGITLCRVTLEAGQARTVDLAFHVDAPSSYDTGRM